MSGPLTSGGHAVLCHYTYEVRTETTNERGVTTTNSDEHPFTVVETAVAVPSIPGLSLHPLSFFEKPLFGVIDSPLASDRAMQLESSELEQEYKLFAPRSSETAVRELFEPSFVAWCLDQASDRMLFEIDNGALVVAIPDHSYDAAQLDGLVDKTVAIATRLNEMRVATSPAT